MISKVDKKNGIEKTIIFSGEHFVSSSESFIETTVGGCIALCLYDKSRHIGGMTHFMLPFPRTKGDYKDAENTKFGINAVYYLYESLLKKGVQKKHLEASVFGGTESAEPRSTNQNIRFIKVILESEDIPIIKSDLGGPYMRKILFDLSSGKVFVKKTKTMLSEV
jgi:chemotaxis protein CheD